jgi:hypothetical protein
MQSKPPDLRLRFRNRDSKSKSKKQKQERGYSLICKAIHADEKVWVFKTLFSSA